MLVRTPTSDQDIVAMMRLAKKMHAEGMFRDFDYDHQKVAEIGRQVLHNSNHFGVLCEQDGEIIGMMVGYVVEFYFGHDLVAQDQVLYVDKTRRGGLGAARMIEKFVEWATEKGAKEIQLGQTVGIDPALVDRLYTSMSFTLAGQLYTQRIV